MEVNTQKIYNNQDELDLISLAEKASLFFKKFGKTILLFSVAGLIIGTLLYYSLPKQYMSKLILHAAISSNQEASNLTTLHSAILTNQEEIEIINTWKDLLKKREYATLSRLLNCNIEVLKKVTGISATEIQKLYTEKNPNGITVDVLVTDTSILDDLQYGIVHGLENSDYVRERIAIKKTNLIDLIQKVKSEITKLDVTKTNVESMFTNKTRSTPALLIDVSGINTQWIELNEKLLEYQAELKFVNAVQVLQGFNKLSKPEKPKLLRLLFFGFIAGGFTGYLVSVYKSVRQKLRNRADANLGAA